MNDLDRRLAEGLGTAGDYVPPTHDLLPEFRRRLGRRRRRLVVERVGLLLVVGAAVVTLSRDRNDAPPPAAVSTTTSTTTAVVAPNGYDIGPALDPAQVRLPDEGVAVPVAGVGVVLVGLDGRVHGHLPGYSVDMRTDTAGPLMLRSRADDYFLLAGNRLEPVPYIPEGPVTVPLAYGAELEWYPDLAPGGPGVRRNGRDAFEDPGDADAFYFVSNDRDIVTQDTPKATRALDLRDGSVSELPRGCSVADRHGSRRYLVCDDRILAGPSTDRSPATLVQPLGKDGHWRRAMVSPDGSRLLLQWSGECEVQQVLLAPSSTGSATMLGAVLGVKGNPTAHAHGWSLDGRAVVSVEASPACGTGIADGGVYVLGERPVRIYAVPGSVDAPGGFPTVAMWAPALR